MNGVGFGNDMVLNDKPAESNFTPVSSYRSLSEICIF